MSFESNPLKLKIRDAAWKAFTDGRDDLEVADLEANEIGKWELMIRVKASSDSVPRYFKLKLSEQL